MSNKKSFRTRVAGVAAASMIVLGAGTLSACSSTGNAASVTSKPASASATAMSGHATTVSAKQVALYSAMRTLWDQHMQWTYDTVVAFASNSPGTQDTINRILQNQVDIGKAIEPYYGAAASKQLTDLLTTHIKEAVPVLQAAKSGDKAALTKAVDAWYANAADIGKFLAAANPAWAHEDMPGMMKEHIDQTITYATDVLTGNYAKAITDYDAAQNHMDQMADMLSAGIVAQFPGKF
ncbi:MAG: hypothetical protein JST73_06405 [Actinobacteria bacterium]|nr:hypothetical protein [Actinomycetota bacterium]